jgi:serine/threonine protein kinase
MFDYIVTKNKLPEPEARYFFRQLVQAMAYTHKSGYAHRDLKPVRLNLHFFRHFFQENLLLKGESRLVNL